MPEEVIDKSNLKQVILDMPKHISEALAIVDTFKVEGAFNSVVITGMGGSAAAGDVLKSYLEDRKTGAHNLRVEVNKQYEIPLWVNEKTLVFVCSYSGNTEETIAAYREAMKKRCCIIAIVSGGKIKEIAEKNNNSCFILPSGIQPRNAICCSFFVMLKILDNSGLIPKQDKHIHAAWKALKNSSFFEDFASDLAANLLGKVPLVYASKRLFSVAYRWKCEFNENTKIHSFCSELSELDHNELVGYTKKLADFHVIFLRDLEDSGQMDKRIKATKALIKKFGVSTTEVAVKGDSYLTRLFSAIMIGDLTSYYLAVEYGIDPTPVKVIEELKNLLRE